MHANINSQIMTYILDSAACFLCSASETQPEPVLHQTQCCYLNVENISLTLSHACKHKFTNHDIHSRFSWVRVVLCFRDSARACAPSDPMLLSECGKYKFDLVTCMQT